MNKRSYVDFGLNEKLNLVLAEIEDANVKIKKLTAVSEQLKVEIEASKTKSKKSRDTAELYKRLTKDMTASERNILAMNAAKGNVNAFGSLAQTLCNHIGLRLPVEDEKISRKQRRGKYITQLSDAEYDIAERMLEKVIPILADAIREVENIERGVRDA